MINTTPTGASKTRTLNQKGRYTISADDLGFSDPDAGDSLNGLIVYRLPKAGSLWLNGFAVTAVQLISAADLAKGLLVYQPPANAIGLNYASLEFSVRDLHGGLDTTPKTLSFNVMPVDLPLLRNGIPLTANSPVQQGDTLVAPSMPLNDGGHMYTGTPKLSWQTSIDGVNWSDIGSQGGIQNSSTFAVTVAQSGARVRARTSYGVDSDGNQVAWYSIATVFLNPAVGTPGNDNLAGTPGADRLAGLAGNDRYTVNNTLDQVVEKPNEGIDIVHSSLNEYKLTANVENLVLAAGALTGRGNELDNTITGNGSNNTLDGGEGNDTLNGGDDFDVDTLIGGRGNDVYRVSAGDQVTENFNEGIDTVYFYAVGDYTLASNVENLVLELKSGSILGELSSPTGRGNELDNTITGTDYNDLLNGMAGADTLKGGQGNDGYWVDNLKDVVVEYAGEGTDTVYSNLQEYNVGANVENLVLLRAAIGRGNTLSNILTGSVGNDLLDGMTGADTLKGGQGNDGYWIDNLQDVVVENAGEGTDTVYSDLQEYNLGANVENLMLLRAAIGRGNTLSNILTGSDGNDLLDGKAGNDTLKGGRGNDGYWVDNRNDVVIENAGEGTDTVYSDLEVYDLGTDVENLVLLRAATGRGNTLSNILTGSVGNDLLDGKAGNDTLAGGTGSDTYQFKRGDGMDMVQENDATAGNKDVLQYQNDIRADQLWLRKVNKNDLEVSILGTTDKVTISNWYLGNQYHVEQLKSGDGKTLLDTQVDKLVQAMAAVSSSVPATTTLPTSDSRYTKLNQLIVSTWTAS